MTMHRCSRGRPQAATTAVLIALLAGPAVGVDILYVDDGAPAGGDGTSWGTAFTYLQDALTAAAPGSGVCEIRVARGTYVPDRDAVNPTGTGDRLLSFQLINDVTLKGGYAGVGASDPDARDLVANESILSGDLAGDDGPNFAGNAENARHVTNASANASSAVLDGFTITGGNGTGTNTNPDRFGAGMLCQAGSPTVRDCLFVANAAEFGGGMLIDASGSPTFTGCVFRGNAGLQQGGGVYTASSAGEPTFIDCAFLANSTAAGGTTGGGMHIRFNATLMNCVFSGNSANRGGGIYVIVGTPLIVNCTFNANTAFTAGGAVSNTDGGGTTITELSNCVLWGNTPDEIDPVTALAIVRNCVVQGGWLGSGTANIDADPLFADALGPDGQAGTGDEDLRVTAGSPAIDAGDDTLVIADTFDADGDGNVTEPYPFDFAGADRFQDGLVDGTSIVDIGAYEVFPDCNGNGVPDGDDIADGTSADCNANGTPDECDIADGTSPDCNGDGVPDECETGPDCNANGVPDDCDLGGGASLDCNANGIPDECDIADGTSLDCNANGVPDDCDIAAGTSLDCNNNVVPDECDIASGTSTDTDGNGIPDECDRGESSSSGSSGSSGLPGSSRGSDSSGNSSSHD
ncbi:MAG: hypothetical protein GY715_03045 [Planctomycetes bacterium]|nr:hypothetical protein [Planctomycetota bacterium]